MRIFGKEAAEAAVEIVSMVAIVIAVCFALVAVIYALVTPFEFAACKSKAGAMGVDSTWGPLQGCMVSVDGKQIPMQAYVERTIEQNVNVKVKP